MAMADSESRPVLGLAENKAKMTTAGLRKTISKSLGKAEKSSEEIKEVIEDTNELSSPTSVVSLPTSLHSTNFPLIIRRQDSLLHSSLSLSASCSSDASTDSFHSRASTGRIYRTSITASRRKQLASKSKTVHSIGIPESSSSGLQSKKRCAWVTPTTGESSY